MVSALNSRTSDSDTLCCLGKVKILQVTSCNRNQDKLWPYGPLSYFVNKKGCALFKQFDSIVILKLCSVQLFLVHQTTWIIVILLWFGIILFVAIPIGLLWTQMILNAFLICNVTTHINCFCVMKIPIKMLTPIYVLHPRFSPTMPQLLWKKPTNSRYVTTQ